MPTAEGLVPGMRLMSFSNFDDAKYYVMLPSTVILILYLDRYTPLCPSFIKKSPGVCLGYSKLELKS